MLVNLLQRPFWPKRPLKQVDRHLKQEKEYISYDIFFLPIGFLNDIVHILFNQPPDTSPALHDLNVVKATVRTAWPMHS